MRSLDTLCNEKELKIIRAIIEELKAENEKDLAMIRVFDQITSQLWSD